jgi:hypothetical protein
MRGSANANLLVNGSFEAAKDFVDNHGGDTMNLAVGSTTMKGWTVIGTTSGAGLAWIGPTNPYGLTAEQGSYFLDLTEENISGPYGGVKQTFATVAGDKYKATFWLGSSSQWGIQDGLTASAAGASKTFTSTNNGSQKNLWQHETFDFTANSASTTLSLLGARGVNYIGLDNVSVTLLTAAAPNADQSSFALLNGASKHDIDAEPSTLANHLSYDSWSALASNAGTHSSFGLHYENERVQHIAVGSDSPVGHGSG